MSERRRSALWGILFGYSGIAVALARNVLFVPIYLKSIPLPEYGAWLATGGALATLLINDFGLAGVVTQRMSAAAGADDLRSFGSLAGSGLGIGGLMAILLTLASLVLLPFLPAVGNLTAAETQTVSNCFLIAVAANAVGIIGATASSIIRSLQNSILAGSIALAADIANISFTLIAIVAGKGLYAIALGMFVRALIIALAALAGVAVLCGRVLKVKLAVRWASIYELLADSSRFFLTSIAMKMQSQANVFFVGLMLGPASAAIYSLTVRAHETVLMLIGQINAALLPSVTHLLGSGNYLRFRAVLLRLLLSMAAITAFAMTVTMTINANFLRLWVGGHVFAGNHVSITMGMALFASSLGYIAYDALLAQGRFRFVSKVFAASSVLHVVLLVSLLRFGLWAAPVVTLATASIWGLSFWRAVESSIALTRVELRALLVQLGVIVTVSAVVIAMFWAFYPEVNAWLALILQAVSCMAALACGYLLCSSAIRKLAREEFGMTMRLFHSS